MKISVIALALVGVAVAMIAAPALAADAAPVTQSWAPSWLTAVWATVATPLAISGAASALSAALPQGERGTLWGFARKVIDAAAWNWGNAKNEPKA